MPLVSVIMPAHNTSRFIDAAIASVRAQSFTDWELLVVDDASTDDTASRVAALSRQDSRVRFLHYGEHQGVADSRNRAIDLAAGRFIAFLDSDDLWAPAKLERQIQFLTATGGSITYGAYSRMTVDGVIRQTVHPPDSVDYRRLLRSNFIGSPTGIYCRHTLPDLRFEAVGNEDYLFWLRALAMLDRPAFATPGEAPLAAYRIRAGSASSNKLKSVSRQWKIHRKALRLGVVQSAFYMSTYGVHAVAKRISAPRRVFPRRSNNGVR